MGNPSKYLAFPFSFGIRATVALKRANRARPQQMKPVRNTVSRYVRRPTVNASNAGATPNDICGIIRKNWSLERRGMSQHTRSAKLSNSCPNKLVDFLHRATLPSRKSNMRPASGKDRAVHRWSMSSVKRYRADEKMDIEPQTPFMIVTRSANRKFLE